MMAMRGIAAVVILFCFHVFLVEANKADKNDGPRPTPTPKPTPAPPSRSSRTTTTAAPTPKPATTTRTTTTAAPTPKPANARTTAAPTPTPSGTTKPNGTITRTTTTAPTRMPTAGPTPQPTPMQEPAPMDCEKAASKLKISQCTRDCKEYMENRCTKAAAGTEDDKNDNGNGKPPKSRRLAAKDVCGDMPDECAVFEPAPENWRADCFTAYTCMLAEMQAEADKGKIEEAKKVLEECETFLTTVVDQAAGGKVDMNRLHTDLEAKKCPKQLLNTLEKAVEEAIGKKAGNAMANCTSDAKTCRAQALEVIKNSMGNTTTSKAEAEKALNDGAKDAGGDAYQTCLTNTGKSSSALTKTDFDTCREEAKTAMVAAGGDDKELQASLKNQALQAASEVFTSCLEAGGNLEDAQKVSYNTRRMNKDLKVATESCKKNADEEMAGRGVEVKGNELMQALAAQAKTAAVSEMRGCREGGKSAKECSKAAEEQLKDSGVHEAEVAKKVKEAAAEQALDLFKACRQGGDDVLGCEEEAKKTFTDLGGKETEYRALLEDAQTKMLADSSLACRENANNAKERRDCEDADKELFMAAGGKADNFKKKQQEAAASAATDLMKDCTSKSDSDKEALKACRDVARDQFVMAGGEPEEFERKSLEAAQKEAASTATSCLEEAGCETTRGSRKCQDKKLEKECIKRSVDLFKQAAGKEDVSASDLKKAESKVQRTAIASEMQGCAETLLASGNLTIREKGRTKTCTADEESVQCRTEAAKQCKEKAKEAFKGAGGHAADFVREQEKAAQTAVADTMKSCSQTLLESGNLTIKGANCTLDDKDSKDKRVQKHWAHCVRNAGKQCDKKAKMKLAESGGDVAEFALAKAKAAKSELGSKMVSCVPAKLDDPDVLYNSTECDEGCDTEEDLKRVATKLCMDEAKANFELAGGKAEDLQLQLREQAEAEVGDTLMSCGKVTEAEATATGKKMARGRAGGQQKAECLKQAKAAMQSMGIGKKEMNKQVRKAAANNARELVRACIVGAGMTYEAAMDDMDAFEAVREECRDNVTDTVLASGGKRGDLQKLFAEGPRKAAVEAKRACFSQYDCSENLTDWTEDQQDFCCVNKPKQAANQSAVCDVANVTNTTVNCEVLSKKVFVEAGGSLGNYTANLKKGARGAMADAAKACLLAAGETMDTIQVKLLAGNETHREEAKAIIQGCKAAAREALATAVGELDDAAIEEEEKTMREEAAASEIETRLDSNEGDATDAFDAALNEVVLLSGNDAEDVEAEMSEAMDCQPKPADEPCPEKTVPIVLESQKKCCRAVELQSVDLLAGDKPVPGGGDEDFQVEGGAGGFAAGQSELETYCLQTELGEEDETCDAIKQQAVNEVKISSSGSGGAAEAGAEGTTLVSNTLRMPNTTDSGPEIETSAPSIVEVDTEISAENAGDIDSDVVAESVADLTDGTELSAIETTDAEYTNTVVIETPEGDDVTKDELTTSILDASNLQYYELEVLEEDENNTVDSGEGRRLSGQAKRFNVTVRTSDAEKADAFKASRGHVDKVGDVLAKARNQTLGNFSAVNWSRKMMVKLKMKVASKNRTEVRLPSLPEILTKCAEKKGGNVTLEGNMTQPMKTTEMKSRGRAARRGAVKAKSAQLSGKVKGRGRLSVDEAVIEDDLEVEAHSAMSKIKVQAGKTAKFKGRTVISAEPDEETGEVPERQGGDGEIQMEGGSSLVLGRGQDGTEEDDEEAVAEGAAAEEGMSDSVKQGNRTKKVGFCKRRCRSSEKLKAAVAKCRNNDVPDDEDVATCMALGCTDDERRLEDASRRRPPWGSSGEGVDCDKVLKRCVLRCLDGAKPKPWRQNISKVALNKSGGITCGAGMKCGIDRLRIEPNSSEPAPALVGTPDDDDDEDDAPGLSVVEFEEPKGLVADARRLAEEEDGPEVSAGCDLTNTDETSNATKKACLEVPDRTQVKKLSVRVKSEARRKAGSKKGDELKGRRIVRFRSSGAGRRLTERRLATVELEVVDDNDEDQTLDYKPCCYDDGMGAATKETSDAECPSCDPTAEPTAAPTPVPTVAPTPMPPGRTVAPTAVPTVVPTAVPTTAVPTAAPTPLPPGATAAPTAAPTVAPTPAPTVAPTAVPTAAPTPLPPGRTAAPTAVPTAVPPTAAPTPVPTAQPTAVPTAPPATVMSVKLQLASVADFDQTRYMESMAAAAGLDKSQVEVVAVEYTLSTSYDFPAGTTITTAQATTAVANANGVAESAVTVTVSGARRLAADVERRLAGVTVAAEIKTTDASTAQAVTTSAANAASLSTALSAATGQTIPAPTVTQAPAVSVAVQTKLVSTTSQAVQAPAADALSTKYQEVSGKTVTAAVANVVYDTPAPTPAPTATPTASPTAAPTDASTNTTDPGVSDDASTTDMKIETESSSASSKTREKSVRVLGMCSFFAVALSRC
eukprot:TRINITY_DN8302_c0_g1_i1.p1 TRINITY_DN8302_c0_g1~~TRINITY_DN8302_c0_g1_i1.p1  ORF type:complete len:2437 (-),score=786.04 TRINITY_DN8302_c0_g1_i1:84-7394(-)